MVISLILAQTPLTKKGFPSVRVGILWLTGATARIGIVVNGDALLPVGKSKNVPVNRNVLPLNMVVLSIQNRLMIPESLHLFHEAHKLSRISLKPERVQSVSIPEFSMIIM